MYFLEDVREMEVKWDSYLFAPSGLDTVIQLKTLLCVGGGKQSCTRRRGFMKFSNEICHPNCLACILYNGMTLRRPSGSIHSKKSVSQPKWLLFSVFYLFSESLHTFLFSAVPSPILIYIIVSFRIQPGNRNTQII